MRDGNITKQNDLADSQSESSLSSHAQNKAGSQTRWLARYRDKDYVKYAITGALNTGLTFSVFSSMILFGNSYLVASSLAWLVGLIVSFTLNSKYVFRKNYQHNQLLTFVISNIFSYMLNIVTLFLLIEGLGIRPILASLITIPIVVTVNFCAVKFVVFR